jgi:CRP-like cAMP-binding protein
VSVAVEHDLLGRCPLFEGIDSAHTGRLASLVRRMWFAEGERIYRQGDVADAFYVLEQGEVEVAFHPLWAFEPPDEEGGARTTRPELTYVTRRPSHPFGWSAFVEPNRYRATATALRPTALLRLERATLDAYADEHPDFALGFARQTLWLVGARLRSLRLRLLAQRYAAQEEAIRALLVEHGDHLSVASPLHRVPLLLAHRLTLEDAFRIIDELSSAAGGVERELAILISELLQEVRAELQLFRRLQEIYELVASAPAELEPEEIRMRCLVAFARLFSDTRHVIAGERHLPERPGHIFVMNHLVNHPDNLLPNDFVLTLDTHFVSSMVLLRRYGDAPIRVVRKSAPGERGHQRFFDRLGYLYVYSGNVDPRGGDPHSTPQSRRLFLDAAAAELAAGRNVVICPEGTSVPTEQSPVAFRAGAFRLAAHAEPEPLLVPIAVANFDKKLTRTRTAAVIGEPWRLSEHVPRGAGVDRLHRFVNESVHPTMANMVREAVRLADAP